MGGRPKYIKETRSKGQEIENKKIIKRQIFSHDIKCKILKISMTPILFILLVKFEKIIV